MSRIRASRWGGRWGSQSWLQPAFWGGWAASKSRLESRLQARLPAPPIRYNCLRQSRVVLQSHKLFNPASVGGPAGLRSSDLQEHLLDTFNHFVVLQRITTASRGPPLRNSLNEASVIFQQKGQPRPRSVDPDSCRYESRTVRRASLCGEKCTTMPTRVG